MKLLTRNLIALALTISPCVSGFGQTGSSSNLIKTFDLVAQRLLCDPARGLVYASVTGSNSVAIIDTSTLTVVKTLGIGSAPYGMSMSPDGTKLYVALSGATKIGVIDLTTLTLLPSLPISEKSVDVE